jgi:hypothetical protein
MTGNDIVAQYGDDGLQLLIVIGATDEFMNNTPTPEYCQALQATQDSHVLYDPNGVMTSTLGIKINMGGALLDEGGHWLTDPDVEESFGEAIGELFTLFWSGPGPGF